jgi:hypothetical protein
VKRTSNRRCRREAAFLIAIVVGWTAGVAAADPPAAAPPGAGGVSQAIELEKKLLLAVDEGNKGAVAAMISDDFTMISAEGRKNKDEILKLVQSIPADQRTKVFDVKAQSVADDVVLVTYRMGGEQVKDGDFWFSSVWARRDGKWLNVFAQTSVIGAQPPPPAPDAK